SSVHPSSVLLQIKFQSIRYSACTRAGPMLSMSPAFTLGSAAEQRREKTDGAVEQVGRPARPRRPGFRASIESEIKAHLLVDGIGRCELGVVAVATIGGSVVAAGEGGPVVRPERLGQPRL